MKYARNWLPLPLFLLGLAGCPQAATEQVSYPYEEPTTFVPLEYTSIEYTPQNYTPAGGDIAPISELLDIIAADDDIVWHAFSSEAPFPISGDCEPDRNGDQGPKIVAGLPVTIEGVITMHPRYFQKHTICGQDERFYGSFFIQDASGGILVLKDSRVSDFTYGDRVRLKVQGLYANRFGQLGGANGGVFAAILAFEDQETMNLPEEKSAIYYEPSAGPFVAADVGRVKRVRGKIVSLATNNNFNELVLEDESDSSVRWVMSIDRELGLRPNDFNIQDKVIEVTGPVIDSFGLRMVIASLGQINIDP